VKVLILAVELASVGSRAKPSMSGESTTGASGKLHANAGRPGGMRVQSKTQLGCPPCGGFFTASGCSHAQSEVVLIVSCAQVAIAMPLLVPSTASAYNNDIDGAG
jgi:hypothetical protein